MPQSARSNSSRSYCSSSRRSYCSNSSSSGNSISLLKQQQELQQILPIGRYSALLAYLSPRIQLEAPARGG